MPAITVDDLTVLPRIKEPGLGDQPRPVWSVTTAPTGYGFVLDMEGEHRMVFDAKAVEQMVEFAMRRMYG